LKVAKALAEICLISEHQRGITLNPLKSRAKNPYILPQLAATWRVSSVKGPLRGHEVIMKAPRKQNLLSIAALVLSVSSLMTVGCKVKDEAPSNDGSTTAYSVDDFEEGLLQYAEVDQTANDAETTYVESSSYCQGIAAAASCQANQPSAGLGLRQANYAGCQIPYSNVFASGNVWLTYNTNSCSMLNLGEAVNRTYSMNYSRNGWQVQVRSESDTDYRGTVYGGGGRLTRTSAGWNIEVLGRHVKFLTPAGNMLSKIDVRTVPGFPIQVEGTLLRANRLVRAGKLEVNHFQRRRTVTYVANNLQYDSSCCYPVSGTLGIEVVDNLGTRSGSATFNGCGSVTQVLPEGTRTITLNSCH
jgi:hypothetical protein